MKKIILSAGCIVAVSAMLIGGTIAYFSDTETSTGNTFTAGELDLKIDSNCHFNGMDCLKDGTSENFYWDTNKDNAIDADEAVAGNECNCVWDEKSLTSEKFFKFANLKPGDSGETTISMHVTGDDAYVRFGVDNIKNYDNNCNIPEEKAECAAVSGTWNPGTQTCSISIDATCGDPGAITSGELGENMDFAIWFDMGSQWGYGCPSTEPNCDMGLYDPEEGDNILNTAFEYYASGVQSGNETGDQWVELKDTDDKYIPFRDCATYYIGVAWCVGGMTITDDTPLDPLDNSYSMTCDGSTADNIIQSDSYISDSIFEVVQATHNDSTNPFGI